MGYGRSTVCLESCKVEGIWPLHPTTFSLPATSLARPWGNVQNCCCSAANLDVADPESLAGYKNSAMGHGGETKNDFFPSFFNHLESQPNVHKFQVKQQICFQPRGYFSEQKKPPRSGVEENSHCKQWKGENTSKQKLQQPSLVEPESRVLVFLLF